MFNGGNIRLTRLDNILTPAKHSCGRCYSGAPSGLRAIGGYFQPLLPTAPPPN
jgi:hypothetical protein